MPNRIIKESCRTSPTLDALSAEAERLHWRLTTAVDDYGRFDANPKVVLSLCFPLKVDKIKPAQVEKWLQEMTRLAPGDQVPLVTLYEVRGRRYGQLNGWSKHQRPARLASKFPDPPDVLTIPSEKNIHDRLFDELRDRKEFCGHALFGVNRNVRAGNGFADLLLEIEGGRILVELKRTRADVGAINQVHNYRNALAGVTCVVIIAAGMGPTVSAGDFHQKGIALIAYDANGSTTLPVSNSLITQCEGLVIPVPSRELHQFPDTRVENRESRIERRESRVERRESRDERRTLSVLAALEEFAYEEIEEFVKKEGVDQDAGRLAFAEFKDYWRSCGGKRTGGKEIKDWPATFRNRIRELKKDGRIKLAVVIRTKPELVVEPKRTDPPTAQAKQILERLMPGVSGALKERGA